MDLFSSCQNANDAKTLHRKLAKCFHPDVGGNKEFMIELQKQYDNFCSNPSSSYHPPGKMFSNVPPFNDPFYKSTKHYDDRIRYLEEEIATRSSQLLRSAMHNHELRTRLFSCLAAQDDCKRLKSLLPCSLWDYWKKREAINWRLRYEK